MKLSKKILFGLAILILFGLTGYLLIEKPQAPALTLTSLKGERFTMESLRGKVVLFNFWATDCPGCIREMPELIRTHDKYQAAGFETIAIAMHYDPPNYVLNFTTKNALPFKVVLDIKGEAASAFGGVSLTPTSFIVDKRGFIVHKIIGEPNFTDLHRLIEKKLAEKIVSLPTATARQGRLALQPIESSGVTSSFNRA